MPLMRDQIYYEPELRINYYSRSNHYLAGWIPGSDCNTSDVKLVNVSGTYVIEDGFKNLAARGKTCTLTAYWKHW